MSAAAEGQEGSSRRRAIEADDTPAFRTALPEQGVRK
jgi:hypothetical protein